jgi:hypothetical protein
MIEPFSILVLAFAATVALGLASVAALNGWRGWLELKRLELARIPLRDPSAPSTAARIELADLRERVRKLEAIASGVDI